jgi:hypothetical protein
MCMSLKHRLLLIGCGHANVFHIWVICKPSCTCIAVWAALKHRTRSWNFRTSHFLKIAILTFRLLPTFRFTLTLHFLIHFYASGWQLLNYDEGLVCILCIQIKIRLRVLCFNAAHTAIHVHEGLHITHMWKTLAWPHPINKRRCFRRRSGAESGG